MVHHKCIVFPSYSFLFWFAAKKRKKNELEFQQPNFIRCTNMHYKTFFPSFFSHLCVCLCMHRQLLPLMKELYSIFSPSLQINSIVMSETNDITVAFFSVYLFLSLHILSIAHSSFIILHHRHYTKFLESKPYRTIYALALFNHSNDTHE